MIALSLHLFAQVPPNRIDGVTGFLEEGGAENIRVETRSDGTKWYWDVPLLSVRRSLMSAMEILADSPHSGVIERSNVPPRGDASGQGCPHPHGYDELMPISHGRPDPLSATVRAAAGG